MSSWADRRFRLFLLPILALNLTYILAGEPRHSTTWNLLAGFMALLFVTYVRWNSEAG